MTVATTDRRAELVDSVASEFIRQGSARASLRDLADAIGTSARMLVHYFQTREALVEAALEVARERQLSAAAKTIGGSQTVEILFENTWRWYQRADTLKFFALFTDVSALERAEPKRQRQFGSRLVTEWLPMFERVFEADARFAPHSNELARLIVSTIRGFALELQTGTKPKDQKSSFDVLVSLVLNS